MPARVPIKRAKTSPESFELNTDFTVPGTPFRDSQAPH
jgi:hypothetical protein